MKPSRGCSGITRHACTQLWATSAPSSLNSSGIEQPKQSQADLAARAKQAMEKQESKSTLSNFPTATTTTNYNPVWDTDSEGKINHSERTPLRLLWISKRSSSPPAASSAFLHR